MTADTTSRKPRILWLHTQPEHYHNCMMDDLARGGAYEYIAAFSHKGRGWYTEVPTPQVARTVFLEPRSGFEKGAPPFRGKFHKDWRADLYPLDFDVAIVAGYGSQTHREVIRDCRSRGIPVAMFSDSNLRSQRGRTVKARMKRALKRRMLRWLIADVDVLLTANRLGVAYWRYYGAAASKIVRCPYYADYARVEIARQTERASALERLKLPADTRFLFSAARLVPAKGLDLAIRAFRELGLALRGWHYVVAGVGPLEAELKAQAGELLGKNIHFIGFQQPSDNLAMMAHADLFLFPSVYEPHGIVVQESMAAGTPVLSSDASGAAYDLVQRGISGELFTSGDSGKLAQKLAALVNDPRRLDAMRLEARRDFERWFAATSPIRIIHETATRMLKTKS
ncbi:MAG: glycosyltransferase family 4 protein [Phycisphaerae bacterium]